jgi:hypothetical protein
MTSDILLLQIDVPWQRYAVVRSAPRCVFRFNDGMIKGQADFDALSAAGTSGPPRSLPGAVPAEAAC